MDTSGWQSLWLKHYNNKSDERWKTKSLNPMPVEHYPIPLPKVSKPTQEPTSKQSKNIKKQKQDNQALPQEQMLPCPKMNKINDTMFCISMERDVHLFYMVTNSEEKAKQKIKRVFGIITFTLNNINERIEQVTGNNSNYIFVRTKNNLVVLEIMDSKNSGTMDGIQLNFTKNIPDLITVLTSGNIVLAISASNLYQFEMDSQKQIKEAASKKIEYGSQIQQDMCRTLMPVGIVSGSGKSLFYFGSRIQQQIDISKLKGAPGEQTERKVKSQALTIVKLTIVGDSKVEQVKGKVYPIDHVFELGIFTRTKIQEIQNETFLVSLHEEVILIKKNFDRYIVWDNVSVVSSKSQSKKGQLILAAKNILVYSENAQIFAHQIFFNEGESKLNMPAIDNFRGNDNDQQILYDALLLFYEDSIMKVLAYIKPNTVVYPTNESNFKKKETDPAKMKDQPTQLEFTIICISQSDPKKKLEQLIEKGKTSQEIEAFCKRFNISKQDQTKSRWNVSQKKLKDIQSILMEIQEDKFIQTELDNILKKESHNLDFLSTVQSKQLSRLKRLLVDRISVYAEVAQSLKNQEESEAKKRPIKEETQKLLLYIYEILQWYLQSDMFLKKVTYSKNFLSFKEYDFIEIGKLKAASLKEQIKLLSSKKYEKRLKYFLNSFKILVISNYEEVFGFLLEKKSIPEIFGFLKQFKFILPNFEETSQVFIQQKNYKLYTKNTPKVLEVPQQPSKKQRHMSFGGGGDQMTKLINQIGKQPRQKSKEIDKGQKSKRPDKSEKKEKGQKVEIIQKIEKEEKCILWDPLEQTDKIPETMECFQQKIVAQIGANAKSQKSKQNAVNVFKKILQDFKGMKWFQNAAFKQHSMITKTTQEVQSEFKEMKRKGAFKILIKILYHKIAQDSHIEPLIKEQLDKFMAETGAIPESFMKNVEARVLVYRKLLQRKEATDGKRIIGLQLPLLQEFIIKSEEKYFDFLFRNIRNKLLTEVKKIYDDIQEFFFRERFRMFLESSLLRPDDIIEFMDSFTEDITDADDIRIDVFSAIKRLLRLKDKVNTKNYILKCMDREVLPEKDDNQTGKLREQAKIPYGFFFFDFFQAFKLDYSYQEVIAFTNTPIINECKIIKELVTRYCKNHYRILKDFQGNDSCTIDFSEGQGIHERIPNVDIHKQPLQFFGLILHLLDVLDFEIEERELFQLLLQNYLNEGKFKELSEFIKKMREYHVTENNLHTNNYKMISDFKQEIDVDQLFIDYTVNWLKINYDVIKCTQSMEEKMKANEHALKMLSQFNKNSYLIKQENSLFELLSNIKNFDPNLILNVEQIKKEAKSNSSFIFLMHRFNQIGVQRFRQFANNAESYLLQLSNFSQMFLSHKLYSYQEIADPSHPDFMRFLIQICIVMIEEGIFQIAKYLITRRIPNDHYYFKDVLFIFLTAIKIDQKYIKDFNESVLKHILLPSITSIIKDNLEQKIINQFRVNQFIKVRDDGKDVVVPVDKKDQKNELKPEKPQKPDPIQRTKQFIQRSKIMFQNLMKRHWNDDAFFYLIRIKRLYNADIISIARQQTKFPVDDEAAYERVNIQFYSYILITSYVKALQLFIEKQFYPTYIFFQSKMVILQEFRERKDIIKDVNIALSKLERLKNDKQIRPHRDQITTELTEAYKAYMNAIHQDPDIKLTEGETRGLQGTKKVEIYTRKSNELLAEENKQETEYKKQLQRNMEKVNKLQEDNRLNVVQRQITEKISEIKKVNERHTLLEADLRKDDHEESLAVRRQRELENIRKQQKQQIESIKDSYKSNTTKRVNQLIENLRKNRQKVAAKRNAPNSAIRDQPARQSMGNIGKPPNIAILQPPSMRKLEIGPQSPKSAAILEYVMPITAKGNLDKLQMIREEMKKSSTAENHRILDLQKRMFSQNIPQHIISTKKKTTLEDIIKIFRQRQSEEACKHIQKYDMLKNPQVRGDFIKRAYAVVNNLQNFIQFLKFLLSLDEGWKESIEEKSISIASQIVKMQKDKEKISMKEIIPAQFFTTVSKLAVKDYYNHAFQIFKPSIRKIFEKQLMQVHAVGILFRYSLGSENRYYAKVFYEYFKVILKNYQTKNMDEKEIMLLAEKIRSNYSSLPETKQQVLEELLMSITNPLKKTRLLQTLKKTLDRKGETLVGGAANKEIAHLLHKILK